MKLALGTVQFGLDYGISNTSGKTDLCEVAKILQIAKDANISFLDTAHAYGNSEEVIGTVCEGQDHWNLITKISSISQASECAQLSQFFYQSLELLRVSSVYGLLMHNADNLMSDYSNAIYEQLAELKERKKVKKIGVSVYNTMQLDAILKHFSIDIVQLPLNVLDQRFLLSGHLDELKKRGVEIHIRSCFLQGLLLMSSEDRPNYFSEFESQLKKYSDFIAELGISPLEAALGFVQSLGQVDQVVVGVNNEQQLTEIINAATTKVDISAFSEFAINDRKLVDPSCWKI